MLLFPAPRARSTRSGPQRRRREQRQAEQQDHAGTCLEKEAARGEEREMEHRARGGETVSVRRGRAGELLAGEDGEREGGRGGEGREGGREGE